MKGKTAMVRMTRCRPLLRVAWLLLLLAALASTWSGHAADDTGAIISAHLKNPEPQWPKESGAVLIPHEHGICLGWKPYLLGLHVGSDSLIALSYYSIPFALFVFVQRRRDLQFAWIFVLFGIFILACGTTHIMAIWTLWNPDYLAAGVIKAVTAVASVLTAAILWPLLPRALALPGPAQWEAVNLELRNEVSERRDAEEKVRLLNAELERRVSERTAELEAANRRLAEANRELGARESRIRESQCLLQAIINNSTAVIYVKDLEGRYLLVNRQFEELFHGARESVAGKTDYDLFPRESADALRAFDRQVLAAGTVLEAEETALQDDGPHTYISIKAPLLDTEGKPYAVCGISTDITERKRDEEEIRRLNAELEQKIVQLQDTQEELVRKEKLATLGRLSGSVGHELRNPLGVISNAVYFLKMVLAEADETTREYLGIIEKEVGNSQRIIADLLDFARTKPPQLQSVAVPELVKQGIAKCEIPDNVTLTLDIPETLPLVLVDPLQIGQVLWNLATNAVQAMPDGGSLRISARKVLRSTFYVRGSEEKNVEHRTLNVERDGDFVEISVVDTGEGISPENMKKLFHPLFTTKPKGIGLGLVVCRNLVEANGGKIEAESEPGKGTTFTVLLPVERER